MLECTPLVRHHWSLSLNYPHVSDGYDESLQFTVQEVVSNEDGSDTLEEATVYRLGDWDWETEQPLVETVIDDEPVLAQYHGPGTSSNSTAHSMSTDFLYCLSLAGADSYCSYKLHYSGAPLLVTVRFAREHHLAKHQLPPEVKDYSKYDHFPHFCHHLPDLLLQPYREPYAWSSRFRRCRGRPGTIPELPSLNEIVTICSLDRRNWTGDLCCGGNEDAERSPSSSCWSHRERQGKGW